MNASMNKPQKKIIQFLSSTVDQQDLAGNKITLMPDPLKTF